MKKYFANPHVSVKIIGIKNVKEQEKVKYESAVKKRDIKVRYKGVRERSPYESCPNIP